MTQTDSRISEKTQSSWRVSALCGGGAGVGVGVGYLQEGVASNDIFGEDEVPEGCNDKSGEETVHAELPGLLALTGAGIDAGHQEDDVQRREGVEDLGDVSLVQARCHGNCPTLRVKFQVCSASLVALEVKMSR